MLDACRLHFCLDSLFYRDNVHADAGAPRWDQFSSELERLLWSQVEHCRYFRVCLAEHWMLYHVFAGTNYPLRDPILDVLIRIISVLFKDTDPNKMIDDLLSLVYAHVVALCKLRCGISDAALFEAEHELYFFLCKQPVEDPEIHMIFFHASRQFARNVICDHHGKLFDELFLFRVVAVMPIHRIISFIHVDLRINFLYHLYPSMHKKVL